MRIKYFIKLVQISLISAVILQNLRANSVKPGKTTLWFPQGVVMESLNGYGYLHPVQTSIASFPGNNPALMSDFDGISFGSTLQWSSKINPAWFGDIRHQRMKDHNPQSFTLVVPLRGFRLGYVFNRKYDSKLVFPPIEINVVGDTGSFQYINLFYQTAVNSHSILLSQSGFPSVPLSLGIGITVNDLDYYEEIISAYGSAQDHQINWIAGLLYDNDRSFQLAAVYQSALSYSTVVKYEYEDGNATPDSFGTETITIPSELEKTFQLTGDLPAQVQLGSAYQITQKITVLGSVCYSFWHTISESYKDQIEISGSAVYRWNEIIVTSLGALVTDRRYTQSSGLYNTNKLSAVYLTAGMVLQWNWITLDIALADSHALSSEWRQETVGKIGVGVNF